MIFVIIFILAGTILLAWAFLKALKDINEQNSRFNEIHKLGWKDKDAPWTTEEEEELKLWDATLMDGLEEEEWDNKQHNENI